MISYPLPDPAAVPALDALASTGITRLLVTGASGLLGSNALLDLAGRVDVSGWTGGERFHVPGVALAHVDITDARAVSAVMRETSPDLVLHLAAMTDVDRCEREPALATRVNEDGATHVAAAAAAVGARLVHVSTDAVYGGSTSDHTEEEAPAPANVYAETKLAGERAALAAHPDALVVRVTMVGFTPQPGRGLLEWALSRLENGQDTPGFADVFFNPVHAPDLVGGMLALIAADVRGVVNLAGSERASKYAFLRALARTFGYDPDDVRSAHVADVAFDAARPADTSMDCSRAASFGVVLPDLEECVSRIRSAAEDGRREALRALVEGA